MTNPFHMPARKSGRYYYQLQQLAWVVAIKGLVNVKFKAAYATMSVDRAYDDIQRLYPHLILTKIHKNISFGYVEIQMARCDK